MTLLEKALAEVVSVLETLKIDYMVIGGIANAVWGEPRATLDIDVTIAVDEERIPDIAARLGQHFRPLIADAPKFIAATRVLPMETTAGVRLDLIFALVPFELEALRRARTLTLVGRSVRVVAPDDLVLMKIISDRPRDLADAEAVARRLAADFDRSYVEPRLRELAAALDKPEIVTRWQSWVRTS